ncbi:MAG: hypothetical protein KGV44_12805 [Flavobacteriaceae bacterium]|nr:hypothetical protein [Flavobacteriaceae bacterium]
MEKNKPVLLKSLLVTDKFVEHINGVPRSSIYEVLPMVDCSDNIYCENVSTGELVIFEPYKIVYKLWG